MGTPRDQDRLLAVSQKLASIYTKSRASVRQDAIIAHEFEEGVHGDHLLAIEHAPDTRLLIKEEARRLLRAEKERTD